MDPEKINISGLDSDIKETNYVSGGGNKKTWENILENIGQDQLNTLSKLGGNVGDLENVIEQTNRFNCPITLNPRESTFFDVAIWLYHHKRLSKSTIRKTITYAKYMQNHKISVDFNNPTYENFRYHMDYREEIEKASPNALEHEWKAMKYFLCAFGIPIWPYKPPTKCTTRPRILPFPDKVREFFYYKYTNDCYTNALYQYIFYLSFMVGWRVPSEICNLTLDDIIIDSKGRGSVIITETKKQYKQRPIFPESYILSSQSHKSFKNWIEKWRPLVANENSKRYLFLWRNGKPVTPRRLGHVLSDNGKKIWPHFKPYDMRHWCAISKLIESKLKTDNWDTYSVMVDLGHENTQTTMKYVGKAQNYFTQYNKSWIHGALRSYIGYPILRGKLQGLKNRVLAKNKTLIKFSPVGFFRPLLAHLVFKEKTLREFAQIIKLCFLGAIKSFTLNPFLSFFSAIGPIVGGFALC